MSARSLGVLLAVTALAVIAAILLGGEEHGGIPERGRPVFPELKQALNQVSEVQVATATESITIAKHGDSWMVREKEGYPAAMGKVRSTVIGLAELRILEPATKNPEHYDKLGLRDLTVQGSDAAQVTLRDADGATLAALLIGKRQPSRADSSHDEIYVRKPGQEQTWLAVGRVRPEKAPIGWVDRKILDLDTQRVRQVRITHPDRHTVLLRKADPGDADFRLLGVPKKAELRSQFSVNNIVDTMAHLTLDDVQPREQVALPARGRLTVRLETFDGLRVTMALAEREDRHYAALSAEFDPALVQARPSEPEPQGGQEGERQGEEEGAGAGEETATADAAAKLKRAEEVRQEAERLTGRLEGWVYILPSFRAETLATRTDELIKT